MSERRYEPLFLAQERTRTDYLFAFLICAAVGSFSLAVLAGCALWLVLR